MIHDAFSPDRLEADAQAFDRAADMLIRIGVPGGDIVANEDASYRRGIVTGHELAVLRLREMARARRVMIREQQGKRWEAATRDEPPEAA